MRKLQLVSRITLALYERLMRGFICIILSWFIKQIGKMRREIQTSMPTLVVTSDNGVVFVCICQF